jgi:Ras-related protein Rab-5C
MATWEDEGINSAPRIIFIGDSGVGKTSIIHRISTGSFLNDAMPTVGTGVTQFRAKTEIGTKQFQLWDTAGQEVYRKIIPIYFKGADAAVIVFSFSDATSYRSIEMWLGELHSNTDPQTTTFIVGNKTDCEHEVTTEEARAWATGHSFPFITVSAKTGEGIEALKGEIIESYAQKKIGRRVHRIGVDVNQTEQPECC